MALKVALISFEFGTHGGLKYDRAFEHDFSSRDPEPNESVQPVVEQAFKDIRMCLAKTVSGLFHFGRTNLENINNFIHIGKSVFHAEVPHTDGSCGQTGTVLMVKFYRLEPSTNYKVTIDIEEMISSSLDMTSPKTFTHGITNRQIEKFLKQLDESFALSGKLEHLPIIRRGRTDYSRFLISSDERVLEYDFDKLLFHKRSDFQDVKIVSSPSLGNLLLLDDLQNLAEIDLDYTYAIMDRKNVSYADKEVLILGGGDGGLLYELLKENPKFVTMAEIDAMVIEACREHLRPCGLALEELEGPRHKIIIDDCMRVMRKAVDDGKKFQVIFSDLTDIPVTKRPESLTAFDSSAVQRDNPWHFIEAIFNLSLACLSDDGLFMMHATGKGNKDAIAAFEDFLGHSRVPVEWESRIAYVPSFMEYWVFYTIRKKQE